MLKHTLLFSYNYNLKSTEPSVDCSLFFGSRVFNQPNSLVECFEKFLVVNDFANQCFRHWWEMSALLYYTLQPLMRGLNFLHLYFCPHFTFLVWWCSVMTCWNDCNCILSFVHVLSENVVIVSVGNRNVAWI